MTNSFQILFTFLKLGCISINTILHEIIHKENSLQFKFPYYDQILNQCMLLHTVWKYNTGMKAFLIIFKFI